MSWNPIFYICGATASGKSSLALSLAEDLDGEIVNIDPYQAYKGLPLLTAAPSEEEQARVPHHLYQCLPLDEPLSAAGFRELVLPVVSDIQKRGKLPLLVGGSGMYLKFLTHGSSDLPSGDFGLRQKMDGMSLQEIRYELEKLDPEESKRLHLDNRRHLSRALEICWLTGEKASALRKEWEAKGQEIEKDLFGLLLLWPRDELVKRIEQRTRELFSTGVVEEVRNAQRLSPNTTAYQAIGYAEILSLIDGNITEEDCLEKITIATRQYAKRQNNWFRREQWLHPVKAPWEKDQLLEQIGKKVKTLRDRGREESA